MGKCPNRCAAVSRCCCDDDDDIAVGNAVDELGETDGLIQFEPDDAAAAADVE